MNQMRFKHREIRNPTACIMADKVPTPVSACPDLIPPSHCSPASLDALYSKAHQAGLALGFGIHFSFYLESQLFSDLSIWVLFGSSNITPAEMAPSQRACPANPSPSQPSVLFSPKHRSVLNSPWSIIFYLFFKLSYAWFELPRWYEW